jgi:L-threonylcarbamoyladenylate synthase
LLCHVVIFSQKVGIIAHMSTGQFVSRCTADAMSNAATSLLAGNLVAFPTETVYGLGADASNPEAVAKIYRAKGRPADHPLIVHIGSMDGIGYWADEISEYAIALARTFWPGPMTLICKRSPEAKDFITGGQDTVGLRVPDHVVALALLDAAKRLGVQGIAAPSANRFGHVSPTTADAVREELDQYLSPQDIILDGGPSQVGVESTIIDCTGNNPHILRPGAITQAMIEEVTGLKVTDAVNEIRVSGSLENHYAPQATVALDTTPQPGDGYIAMSDKQTPAGVIRLASPQSVEEYARILYSSLRDADSQKLTRICIDQPRGDGLAIAICDRLQRAARGR